MREPAAGGRADAIKPSRYIIISSCSSFSYVPLLLRLLLDGGGLREPQRLLVFVRRLESCAELHSLASRGEKKKMRMEVRQTGQNVEEMGEGIEVGFFALSYVTPAPKISSSLFLSLFSPPFPKRLFQINGRTHTLRKNATGSRRCSRRKQTPSPTFLSFCISSSSGASIHRVTVTFVFSERHAPAFPTTSTCCCCCCCCCFCWRHSVVVHASYPGRKRVETGGCHIWSE